MYESWFSSRMTSLIYFLMGHLSLKMFGIKDVPGLSNSNDRHTPSNKTPSIFPLATATPSMNVQGALLPISPYPVSNCFIRDMYGLVLIK